MIKTFYKIFPSMLTSVRLLKRLTTARFIPFPRNKITFERVKAPRLSDRKRVHINLILTRLRSLKRRDFHAAQM
jgi:hypothetical protein